MRLRVSITELPHACPQEGVKGLGWSRQGLFGLSLKVSFFFWVHFPIISKVSRTSPIPSCSSALLWLLSHQEHLSQEGSCK